MELIHNEVYVTKREAQTLGLEGVRRLYAEELTDVYERAQDAIAQLVHEACNAVEEIAPQLCGGIGAIAIAGTVWPLHKARKRLKGLDAMRPTVLGLSMETIPSRFQA